MTWIIVFLLILVGYMVYMFFRRKTESKGPDWVNLAASILGIIF